MSERFLHVSDLATSYGDFRVSGVGFELWSGEIMGLVGKSGAGKSMLIKTLMGLKQKDSGMVYLKDGGESVELQKDIGYSPQENSLYPFLTVQENLQTFGKLRGLSREEIRERSEALLKQLDIYDARKKRVSELSGGMKKRTDIATALLHNPALVVLDEPFTGLDPHQRDVIWGVMENRAAEGHMFILTSHLIGDLSDRCSKYGLIHNGQFYDTNEIEHMMSDTDYHETKNFLRDSFRL